MNPKIKCVIFDIGSTLHKSTRTLLEKSWKKQTNYLKKAGYKITYKDFKIAIGNAWKKRLNRKKIGKRYFLELLILKNLGIKPNQKTAKKLNAIFFETRARNKSKRNLSKGANHLISSLKARGIIIGIISDSDTSWARQWLKRHKIPISKKLIVISNEVNVEKSSKRIFELFYKKLKDEFSVVAKNECLMVGDQEKDLNAKKAGFQTCLYNPKMKSIEQFKIKPDFMISSFKELGKAIL